MIRIKLYKESINNYIKNSNIEKYLNIESDFILPITGLTMMNNIQRKSKNNDLKHIYDIAMGMEILENYIICDKNNDIKVNQTIINQYSINLLQIIKTDDFKKYIDIYKLLNDRFNIIKKNKDLNNILNNQNNDNTNFKIISINDKNIKQIPKKIFLTYVDNTYNNVCELMFIISWIFGGYNYNVLKNFKLLSSYFGNMNKILYDVKNYNNIINNLPENYVNNYVINYGFQDTFEFYLENKQKFIEGLITMELMSATMNEIITYMDDIVNGFLSTMSPSSY
jgi:hypothetical protein